LEQHCDNNVAINSGYAIIDAYIVRGDLAQTREWTEKLAGMGCGEGEAGAKFAGDLKVIGNAVRFKEANILFEEGKFEMAADRYLALVDEAPDDPDADRALNNAAVAYEKIGRFASASQTYTRIYTKYPDSEFADDALLRTGLNHARFFEFEEAVQSYLRLAEDDRYEESEHRLNALKNAANLLDGLQQYKRAADLHRKYADKTEDEIERAEALFRAAKILGKTKDHKRTIAAYKSYLKAYESVPDEAEHVVESHLRIGIAYSKLDNRKKAESAYRMSVGIFGSSGLKAGSEGADLASEAQFRLAEYSLTDVLEVKLTGTGKKFEKQAKRLFDRVLVSAAEYDAVFPYLRIEWVVAAMFRRGYAFETVAQKVRSAPIPPQLKKGSESWFAYKELVDKQMSLFENKAVGLYEETVKRSREYKISNEWTQRARERLNVYKPDEYPLLRPAAVGLEVEDRR
jgi:tetratricopeptide (TPR) repeat protein